MLGVVYHLLHLWVTETAGIFNQRPTSFRNMLDDVAHSNTTCYRWSACMRMIDQLVLFPMNIVHPSAHWKCSHQIKKYGWNKTRSIDRHWFSLPSDLQSAVSPHLYLRVCYCIVLGLFTLIETQISLHLPKTQVLTMGSNQSSEGEQYSWMSLVLFDVLKLKIVIAMDRTLVLHWFCIDFASVMLKRMPHLGVKNGDFLPPFWCVQSPFGNGCYCCKQN